MSAPEPTNWRGKCAEADRMDGGGERHQRTSAFQARRQAQIEVLQGAWAEMFSGSQLTRDSAKDMLNLTDDYEDYAEKDVVNVMVKMAANMVQ